MLSGTIVVKTYCFSMNGHPSRYEISYHHRQSRDAQDVKPSVLTSCAGSGGIDDIVANLLRLGVISKLKDGSENDFYCSGRSTRGFAFQRPENRGPLRHQTRPPFRKIRKRRTQLVEVTVMMWHRSVFFSTCMICGMILEDTRSPIAVRFGFRTCFALWPE